MVITEELIKDLLINGNRKVEYKRKRGEKCLICEVRPARDNGICHNCMGKVDAMRNGHEVAFRYLTWRGAVVGLFTTPQHTYTGRLLGCSPDTLPKSRTINLDEYCEGYSRDQIKKFKVCIIRLVGHLLAKPAVKSG